MEMPNDTHTQGHECVWACVCGLDEWIGQGTVQKTSGSLINEDEGAKECLPQSRGGRAENCIWPIMQSTGNSWNKFNRGELNNRQG